MEPSTYLGSIIADRYVVEELIGSGGFAWVYRGSAPDERTVAIKVLHNTESMATARFQREIKVLKSMPENRHVVEYIDDGFTEKQQPFLVLGFIEGRTLMLEMSEWRRLEPRRAVEFLSELCEAFIELHRLGVAHRDVKPENIVLTARGAIKLIDFGLIRDAQGILKLLEQDEELERRIFQDEIDRWLIAGTPEYMAPEQFTDALAADLSAVQTDTWSDVFSLGVILYELIAGSVPFPLKGKAERREVRRALLRYMRWRMELSDDDVPSCPGIDRELDSIICKALRVDPRQRQPNAQALKDDLQRYLASGKGVRRDYDTGTLAMTYEEIRELEAKRRQSHSAIRALERAFDEDEGLWGEESTFSHFSAFLCGPDTDELVDDEDEDTIADPTGRLASESEGEGVPTTRKDLRSLKSWESSDQVKIIQDDSFVIIDLPPPGGGRDDGEAESNDDETAESSASSSKEDEVREATSARPELPGASVFKHTSVLDASDLASELDEATEPKTTKAGRGSRAQELENRGFAAKDADTLEDSLSLQDTVPEQLDPPGGSVFNQTWVLDVSDLDEELPQPKKPSRDVKDKGEKKADEKAKKP